MYKVIYSRYGKTQSQDVETRAEAHRKFNFIRDYGFGFSELILDENNNVVRASSN